MKNVLNSLTNGPVSGLGTSLPAKNQLRSSGESGSDIETDGQVNSRMKGINEQHFLQLLATLKCYTVPEKSKNNVKAFGMYVVMNQVYFTALHVASDLSSADPVKFLFAPNTGNCRDVNLPEFSHKDLKGVKYHMMQTRGLNWLNAEHCKAMIAFTQYLMRRNSGT